MSESTSSDTRYMLEGIENPFRERFKKKPLDIQKYKGHTSNIKIENWLKIYERVVKYMMWTEEESILYLSTYLEDDALEWYSSNLDRYENFYDVKEDLTAQYGIGTSDPLKKALDVEYDPKTGIKPYFDNIKRYAGLAGLNQKNTLSILKQNLPNNIKDFIGGVTIDSYSQFYNIVQEAEENVGRKRKEFEKERYARFIPVHPNTTIPRARNPPPFKPKHRTTSVPLHPCRICVAKGLHNRYHWMEDCKNKTPQTDNSKEVNCHEIENDINKIHLN